MKLEKGIDIPEVKTKQPKYPWHEMEIGDSFLIEEDDEVGKARVSMSSLTNGKQYTSRKVAGGTRFWRTV